MWALTEPRRIAPKIFEAIGDPENKVTVSAVAVWEVAIKHRLARPDSPPFSGHETISYFERVGFASLEVTAAHVAMVERLPPLHADPLDRLMLAQAIIEVMLFVTYDRNLSRYDVPLLTWS